MSADLVARGLAAIARARTRTPIAIGILGQSNERGEVDPAEAIGGVASRTALPQAYRSLRNPGLRYPIGPAVTRKGGMWFRLYDELHDWGYDARIVNGSIGSLSMLSDGCGQVHSRASATGYHQRRDSIGPGDPGHQGDYMVDNGRLFLCTKGRRAFASNLGMPIPGDTANVPELDYRRVIGSEATASSPPAALATAVPGDVIVDGGIEWTCLSASTMYRGFSYTAGTAISESRAGFDPYGILRRLHAEMQRIRDARHRIIVIQNGQSDTSLSAALYSSALQQVAGYFLQRGYRVLIGLSYFNPASTAAAYATLSTGVTNAIAALKANANAGVYYDAADVQAGANLFQLLGSGGNMAAGGGYFAKDAGQDNLHVNAAGAIAGGAAWAQVLKAALPRGV